MKSSSFKAGFTGLLLGVITLSPAWAVDATPIADQMASALRERLFPIVDETLKLHCGEGCPSFKIVPQFKGVTGPASEDLGFTKSAPISGTPEMSGVSIIVVTDAQASKTFIDSLKQIVVHRIGNEVSVPVSVQTKPIALAPKASSEKVTGNVFPLETLVWPITAILLGTLAFVAMLVMRRPKPEGVRDDSKKGTKDSSTALTLEALELASDSKLNILQERLADLEWLIEDRCGAKDVAGLQKVLQLFDSQELTTRMRLSAQALRFVAALPEAARASEKRSEAARWLGSALDRAHWRRMEEERHPLLKAARLSEEQLSEVFSALPSMGEKAVLLSAVSKDRWPLLLTRIGSEDRIQLGLKLAQYESAAPADRRAMEAVLLQRLTEALDASTGNSLEGVVEDFSLFLPEKEGQKLWQELTARAKTSAPTTIDAMLGKLDPAAALEICMGLEPKALKALMDTLSAPARKQLHASLPKSLRDRLDALVGKADEAFVMKARAEWVSAYRKFAARV